MGPVTLKAVASLCRPTTVNEYVLSALQAQSAWPGGDDGRARLAACAGDDPALGASVCPKFIKRWNRFGRGSGRSWRVDESYITVRGRRVYLYREVDKAETMVDFRLSDRRDCDRRQGVLQESDQTSRSCTPYDRPRWPCGLASCRAGDAERRHAAQRHEAAVFEVSEHSG
jgi:DDE domain